MAKEKYLRERPHISVGTIGPAGHGKTTLTAAIVNFLSDRGQATGMSYDMISKGGVSVSGNKTITVFPAHIEYRTYDRHYSHLDCPGDLRYAKNIIAGAAQMDAAILVVSAAEFVAQQVDEHVRLAKHAGVRQIVVFINKCELTERPPICDPEVVDAVEAAVREILDANKLDGDMVSVIRGSGLVGDGRRSDRIAKHRKIATCT